MKNKNPKLIIYVISILALLFGFISCNNGDNGTGPEPDPEPGEEPTEAPEINSVEPDSGEVGDEIVIYGANFSATASENSISFNGTNADASDASEDSLVTSVPEGATDGPIEVTVDDKTATSPSDFKIITNDSTDNGNGGSSNTISQAVSDDPQLSMLADYLEGTDLQTTLDADGPYTLLAPIDDVLDELSEYSQTEIESILSYHVIDGDVSSNSLAAATQSLNTLNGESVFITNNGSQVNNHTRIVSVDIETDNGRIHKVDDVLWPDTFLDVFEITFKRYETNKFACTCVSGRTGLESELKDESTSFTIFAPSDDAFASRTENVDDMNDEDLRNLLNYHIIEGESLRAEDLSNGDTYTTRNGGTISISISGNTTTINGSAVVETTNLEGTNGVVHIIDTVLEP